MITKEAQQQRAAYRLVSVPDTAPFQKKEENLFYVGENVSMVATLAGSFRMGYASSINLQQAISFVRELQKEECRFRGFMIDVPLHKLQLAQFLKFISTTPYADLPILYVSTHLTESEFQELSASHIVDDVVHPIRDIFTIGERIEFLRKVKAEAAVKTKRPVVARSKAGRFVNAIAKRVLDVIISSVLIILTAPLMAVVALLIRLDSRGPVFHNSYRAGRGYKVFKFYRFRTSKVGAARLVTSLSQVNLFRDNGASFMKACDENSLTPVGRFLRRTSLVELPQLVNVLKGDMSLVGNRPLPLHKASALTSDEFAERFNAPAGITGLWQVSGREKDSGERIRLDLVYAREHNIWMDAKILWRTPAAVWRKMKKAQRNGL